MAVTSYKTPGSGANVTGIGTVAWSNPSNVGSSNNVYATAALPADGRSNYLRAYNFDFSEIPSGATIDGVEVSVEAKGSVASRAYLTGGLCTTSAAVVGTSQTIPTAFAYLTTSDVDYVAGGSADMWGTSLDTTIVKGSNFGLMIWSDEGSGAGAVTTSVDQVRLRVYYTPANVNYTLNAAAGSLALTNVSAGFRIARKLAANPGAGTLTGFTAGISAARRINAGIAPFAVSGQATGISRGRKLPTATGSISFVGNGAAFKRSVTIPATVGPYALTGYDVGFDIPAVLYAATGQFALSGSGTGFSIGRRIALAPGAFSLSGTALQISRRREMPAAAGMFALTGRGADLVVTDNIPVVVGPDFTMVALPNRIEDRTMVAPSNRISDRTMIAQG